MSFVVLDTSQANARKFCTRQSAATFLDVDPSTVARWVDKLGLAVFYDPEGRPRYLWSEVESLITAKRPKEFRGKEQLALARSCNKANA